LTSFR